VVTEPLPSYQQFLIVGFRGYESCTRCLATARLERTYFLRYFCPLGRMPHFSLLVLFLILIQSAKRGKWNYTIHRKIVMPEHTYLHFYIDIHAHVVWERNGTILEWTEWRRMWQVMNWERMKERTMMLIQYWDLSVRWELLVFLTKPHFGPQQLGGLNSNFSTQWSCAVWGVWKQFIRFESEPGSERLAHIMFFILLK
jgi:hypothetical protein